MSGLGMQRMTRKEFDAWRAPQIVEYAAEMARNARRATDDLMAQSRREFAELLPHGVDTPGHRLLIAFVPETGRRIGWLWIAEREADGGKVAWIYDIVVEENLRGRGYGRALMAEAEVQAREMGLTRIALNVFGDNAIARSLYGSSGYHETARQMAKDL
ncbi:MAG: GNAT family N-acetyltransferase [Actinomycetota bacterium]